jgi:hypothetical protein
LASPGYVRERRVTEISGNLRCAEKLRRE